MGLLQKLSDSGLYLAKEEKPALDKPLVQVKSNSVGLLKKSLNASSDYPRLDFFEFVGKYNLEIASILKCHMTGYRIQNCTGYDGQSICLSSSSQDFWQGTISRTNTLYSYNAQDSSALPFFQFFSKQLKEKIQTINIIKTVDNSIFFIFNKQLVADDAFIKDLKGVENTEVNFDKPDNNPSDDFASKVTLDFSEALESFILSNSKNDAAYTRVILEELYYRLCKNFSSPDKLLYNPNGKFTLYLSREIPLELLYNHLKLEEHFILANHSELISITECQNSSEAEK